VGYTPKMATAVWVGFPQGNVPMGPNGFGGTLAAPIWKAYMVQASNGYCGDFPLPTTPWSGTAFFGAHSAGGPASHYGTGTTGPGTGTTNSGSGGTSPYNNPALFAQPTTPSGSGGTAPTPGPGGGGGGGAGHGGNAHGHGGGGNNH
jgi:penicillin-binding protein 1A